MRSAREPKEVVRTSRPPERRTFLPALTAQAKLQAPAPKKRGTHELPNISPERRMFAQRPRARLWLGRCRVATVIAVAVVVLMQVVGHVPLISNGSPKTSSSQ
jgi:hypothetical protein